jgi:hypothetical protein
MQKVEIYNKRKQIILIQNEVDYQKKQDLSLNGL